MATNLTFTSGSFIVGTTMSATSSTSFSTAVDILGGTVSYDRRLYSISATSTDTTARDMTVWLYTGATGFQVGKVAIALSSGNTNAVSQTDVMGSSLMSATFQKEADSNGKPYINLPAGWGVKVGIPATTAGTYITTIATGENYN